MPASKLMIWYGLWMTALTAAHYALPNHHMIIWGAIGLSGAAAVLIGIRRHRPRRTLPWIMLAASLLAFCAGDTTYNVLTNVLGQENPFPSASDAVYIAGFFPLCVTAILMLVRSGVSYRDRAGILDALTLTSGVGLLSWIFLINPQLTSPDLTPVEKSISVAYPLYDIMLLAIVVRLVTTARTTPALLLLGVGGAGMLVADVLYGLNQLGGSWSMGGPIDLGWIVTYAAWGAAALHPSMHTLTEPRGIPDSRVSTRRLAALTLCSLIPPAVLLVQAQGGAVTDGGVIGLLSAVMFLLVSGRLAGVANSQRQAVVRERGLRESAVALLSATNAEEVRDAVCDGVVSLLPPSVAHEVVLVVNEAGSEPAEGTLAGYAVRLECPLTLDDRPSGNPHVGTLFVAASEVALAGLRGPVEVLASQAALALERISLTNEINRRDSEAYFRSLVQNTADVILILDPDNRIRYASPSADLIFGAGALTGVRLVDALHPADRVTAGQTLDLLRAGDHRGTSMDWTMTRADGGLVQVEASCRDLSNDHTVRGMVVTLRDVTERRRLEREITHQAFHDSLTGLANRVLFADRAQQAVARAERSGDVVGILIIDVDDFKITNDTIGHAAGDQLLIAVGRRIATMVRPHDTAARLGGDEFAILIEDAQSPADVEEIAGRILGALTAPFQVGDNLLNGAASIGVATTADADSENELLRQADLALYVAKGAGKGQWRRYQSSVHTAVVRRLELRSALEQAIADDAFTLQYQPIVELTTGETVGLEALVRWNHPTRGMVPPGEFIGVAEESGLIVPLGTWVLEQSIATAAQWHRTMPGRTRYISVNVSARQFRSPGFVAKVRRELANSGLPARCLLLEITESLLLPNDGETRSDLQALRNMGIRIAIDDFGTGYSSLSYLRTVPIDVLKIDRSFVDQMSASAQQRALVDGIVRLAFNLGLEVVAEGIEQAADRALLVEMGCPFGQGYLYARPLNIDDAVRWLATAEEVSVA